MTWDNVHQADIALWNLVQLGNAIYPLVEEVEPLQEALGAYSTRFEEGRRCPSHLFVRL